MTFSLLAHTHFKGAANGGTTPAIDTTGADLIVLGLPYQSPFATPTDSAGNTWTALTGQNSTTVRFILYYCVNPITSASHTFSSTGQTNSFEGVYVGVFSGAASSPFDVQNGAFNSTANSSIQPGSITPSQDDELIIIGACTGATSLQTVDSGFTMLDTDVFSGGVCLAGGLAYLIQTSKGAVNPTWSNPGSGASAVAIASFKSKRSGAVIVTEDPDVLAASGSLGRIGTIALTEDPDTFASAGTRSLFGSVTPPVAIFPPKFDTTIRRALDVEKLVDPQRRPTPAYRRWMEAVDLQVRRQADITKFTRLTDAPNSYSGQASKIVRVNADESALEFANPSSGGAFVSLSDVPASYSGAALKGVRVNAGATGLEFHTPAFVDLADAPANYTSAGLKNVRVNAGATALEFHAPAFVDLVDGPASFSGAALKALRANAGATALEFYTPPSPGATVFTGLSDVPGSYSGAAKKIVRVNAGATALEFAVLDKLYPDLVTPVDGNYSWVNQGGASVTVNANGGIALRHPATGTTNLRARVLNAPATPYTLTAAIFPAVLNVDFQEPGICFRESGTSKLITLDCFHSAGSGTNLHVGRWTNPTTFSADSLLAAKHFGDGLIWLRIANDGTNLIYSYSIDGFNFIQIFSQAKNAFFTTGPDQVGFHTINTHASFDCINTLMSWTF